MHLGNCINIVSDTGETKLSSWLDSASTHHFTTMNCINQFNNDTITRVDQNYTLVFMLCTYYKKLVQLNSIHIMCTTANKTNPKLVIFLVLKKRICSVYFIILSCRICSSDHSKQVIYLFLQYQLSWILAAENQR